MCKTLANPKRQQIIDTLRDQEMTVSEIVELTDISQSNVSQHLRLMRDREILVARREGNKVFYNVADPKILNILKVVREVFCKV